MQQCPKKRILDDAPEHIITGPWKRLVYDAEGRIQRAGYSLCLLERLQDALRRRDIWLESSDRWGDPREKLLQGEEWQTQRIPVCRALGHPVDGRKGVQQLAIQLDETWKAVASRFEKNAEVHICNEGVVCGRGRNPTLRLWPTIFSGKIDVFPGDRRSRLISSMTSVAPA